MPTEQQFINLLTFIVIASIVLTVVGAIWKLVIL